MPPLPDLAALTRLRHELHRFPELSGEEAATARRLRNILRETAPDTMIEGLGGHGLACVYTAKASGPTVMIRCELDALPIEETTGAAHRSTVPGKAHLCGHDGHMAILVGLAQMLARTRPTRGRVVLLFQPAEETGAGARRVVSDPKFAAIAPDIALALHNFPGLPLGRAAVANGVMNCASRGMKLRISGRTAHASQPETGVSPAPVIARLVTELTALARGQGVTDPNFARVTITHLRVGEPTFGVAPGAGELWATLRSQQDAGMARLVDAAEACVARQTAVEGLSVDITYEDIFNHCENHPDATAILMDALRAEDIPIAPMALPMRASEDFGVFGHHAKAAMVLLGAGEDAPSLHNPDYDFPDALIPVGIRLFHRCLSGLTGSEPCAAPSVC